MVVEALGVRCWTGEPSSLSCNHFLACFVSSLQLRSTLDEVLMTLYLPSLKAEACSVFHLVASLRYVFASCITTIPHQR